MNSISSSIAGLSPTISCRTSTEIMFIHPMGTNHRGTKTQTFVSLCLCGWFPSFLNSRMHSDLFLEHARGLLVEPADRDGQRQQRHKGRQVDPELPPVHDVCRR